MAYSLSGSGDLGDKGPVRRGAGSEPLRYAAQGLDVLWFHSDFPPLLCTLPTQGEKERPGQKVSLLLLNTPLSKIVLQITSIPERHHGNSTLKGSLKMNSIKPPTRTWPHVYLL